jgi:ABC-2 type transport system ATP-binding protein
MTAALSIRNLTKVYNNKLEALKGISLDVMPGDFFAVLGPNGAGKSTMIGIISSLVRKTAGTVEVFGTNIDTHFSQAKKYLGVVPQEFNFNLFEKVEDIIMQQAGYYGLPRAYAKTQTEKYLQKLHLWEKRGVPARTLSGGMKRRLMIARALVHDIELRRSMWEFLREINEAGTTIILTTHYLEEAESLCRNVAIIDKGLLIKNTSVKNLLQGLHKEVFVFDVATDLPQVLSLPNFVVHQIDARTFEIEVEKGQLLNEVFVCLSQQGINVVSMRNKANRLEEMFVSMIAQSSSLDSSSSQTDAKKIESAL